MESIWIWRVYGNSGSAAAMPDITGFDVEAADGRIGKVDDTTKESREAAIVVDTGFWIFGKKRMLPAGVVDRIDEQEQKVYISCTKDQVKNAPEYEESRRDDADYRDRVGTHYRSAVSYEGDPISPNPGPDLPRR
jgi:PRC-barrel domain